MTPLAHVSSGLLIAKLLETYTGNLSGNVVLGAALAGSLAPDIDGLFGNKLNNHRNTVFHTPIFWMGVLALGTVFDQQIACVFTLGVLTHLFLDWVSARTGGVRLLWPISKKAFSWYKLRPEMGEVPVMPNKDQVKFWKYYFENKLLVGTEAGIILLGMVSIFS